MPLVATSVPGQGQETNVVVLAAPSGRQSFRQAAGSSGLRVVSVSGTTRLATFGGGEEAQVWLMLCLFFSSLSFPVPLYVLSPSSLIPCCHRTCVNDAALFQVSVATRWCSQLRAQTRVPIATNSTKWVTLSIIPIQVLLVVSQNTPALFAPPPLSSPVYCCRLHAVSTRALRVLSALWLVFRLMLYRRRGSGWQRAPQTSLRGRQLKPGAQQTTSVCWRTWTESHNGAVDEVRQWALQLAQR